MFDSGLGGLTVAKRVLERLPKESIVYFADQAHVPYGEKSPDTIRRFALGVTEFMVSRNCKLVIMACNMSSATALDSAREYFAPIPVIGVIEAGARSAVHNASGGPIGVLATTGTVKTGAYTRTLHRLMPEVEVVEQACPRFVPIVEGGRTETPDAEDAVKEYAQPLLAAGCKTIILGCTHYPFFLQMIEKVVGPDVKIVDPALETTIEAAEILRAAEKLAPIQSEPGHEYFTSGCPEQFADIGSSFLGVRINSAHKLKWGTDIGEIEWQEKMVAQTIKSAL